MNDAGDPRALMPRESFDARPPAGERIGVLLVNLGTPDAPDAGSVRRYLREFLSDPRVIESQGLIWQLVLNGVILPIRSRRKAHEYRSIWNDGPNESPLKTITRSQAEKLAAALQPLVPKAMVEWAMRYGNPAIAGRLRSLVEAACTRALVVPLYPQYCAATTATVVDEVFRVLAQMRFQPTLRFVPPYYSDPAYIEAVSSSVVSALARLDFKPEVLLASFHGVPKAFVEQGDPYDRQCTETARLLREALRLEGAELVMTFQSRFGRAQWLEPATNQTLRKLAESGVKRVAVFMPGFAADCIETLEEIAVENAHVFKSHGGEKFAAIPCLNDSEEGMQLIRHLVLRELNGWI